MTRQARAVLALAQAAFSPDYRFLATNNLDGLQIRDVRTGPVALRLAMPETVRAAPRLGSFAACFAFASDGRIATGYPDSTILVWDLPLLRR